MTAWEPIDGRLASFLAHRKTSGSIRIAMSCRAEVPSGGRPEALRLFLAHGRYDDVVREAHEAIELGRQRAPRRPASR